MKTSLILLMPLLSLLLLPVSSQAEIYKYTDSEGNLFFTDSPPAGTRVEKVKTREDRIEVPPARYESLPGRQAPGPAINTTNGKRPFSDIHVIMYMTSWCPYCKKAGAFLRSLGVRLTEYDIEKDASKNREMLSKGYGKGVPLIDVEGIVIRGYNPSAIEGAVEKRRKL